MGKSEKPRTPTSTHYPYAPVRVSQQQLLRGRHGEGEGAMGMYATGHPVFSARDQGCHHDMKHLEFLRAFGQYYYSKVSQVYASSCAFLPMSCQAGLRNIETKVGCYSAPLMEGSERVLVNLDDKVDSVFKMLHSRPEADGAVAAKSSQMNYARFEESLQYLREHGLSGLARHAMRMVMSSDGATESSADVKALRDTAHQDSWSQFAMSPVTKVIESAETGLTYTQQVYGDAHRAIISSPTYNNAVDVATEVVQRVQESTLYKASAKRFYPAISGIADPALERLVNSGYTKALVNHLKPIPQAEPKMPALVCATC